MDASNRPPLDEVLPVDDPHHAVFSHTKEASSTTVLALELEAPRREILHLSSQSPAGDGMHASPAAQMSTGDPVDVRPLMQLPEVTSMAPQALHLFNTAHTVSAETFDVAVASGNITRVMERHSHTHLYLSPQWIFGASLFKGPGRRGRLTT